MNVLHTLISLAALAFVQASPNTFGSTEDNAPKVTSDTRSPPLKVGDSFLVARSQIRQAGWQPIRMHSKDDYDFFGTERDLIDREFMEFEHCSMDAGALCIFYYKKKTKCLRVDTIGEHIKDMKVTGWTGECPEEGSSAKEYDGESTQRTSVALTTDSIIRCATCRHQRVATAEWLRPWGISSDADRNYAPQRQVRAVQ